MGYLTAKQFSEIWGITESNIYKYINTQKRIMIANINEYIKEFLIELIEKEGYIVECYDINSIEMNNESIL